MHQILGANRSKIDDFKITSAKTEDLNGMRVLTIEGRYPQHGLSARSIFIDSDGTGSAVQEVTFQAQTAELFQEHIGKLECTQIN